MSFSIESFKSFVLGQINNKYNEQNPKELFANSIFSTNNNIEDIIGDIFEKCDTNNNDKLEDAELKSVASFLGSYGEFSGITTSSIEKSSELTEAEANVRNLIQDDTTINDDLKNRKLQNDTKLNEVQTQIEDLSSRQGSLTDEEKAQLDALQTEKELLIETRDDLESEVLEDCDEETKTALLELIEQRNSIEEGDALSPDITPSNPLEKVNNNRPSSSGFNPFSGDTTTTASDNNTQKSIEQMSLSELTAEKSTAEGKLTEKQEALDKVLNGSNEELVGLQENIQTAENAYLQMLQEVSPELYEQLEEQLGTKKDTEKLIGETEVSISKTDKEIKDITASIASLTGKISSYEGSISNLENTDTSEMTSEQKTEISNRIEQLKKAKKEAQDEKIAANDRLTTAKSELEKLNGELEGYQRTLDKTNETIQGIQTQISGLENSELITAQDAYNQAVTAYDERKNTLRNEAEKAVKEQQAEIDKIQEQINLKEQKEITNQGNINNINNPEGLYESMGLEDMGMNKEVFLMALEGYNNLTDEQKETGLLGIFDTTQSNNAERYYLIDLNNFEVIERSQMRIGSGNMDNILTANKGGSHATLSGFEMVAEEYYSSSMGKRALRLDGLEEGINDNSRAKGTVVHYTTANTTWGCKGFPPVYTNGRIDKDATYERMRELCPTGTILFTAPTDSRYEELSALV